MNSQNDEDDHGGLLPEAEGNSPQGHPRHRGTMVLTIHQTAMK